ncbi:MAG: hypothetical protein IKD07_00210 [Clostridia bacterium]|nr:hypothetical protein [Clostridia bacterium]
MEMNEGKVAGRYLVETDVDSDVRLSDGEESETEGTEEDVSREFAEVVVLCVSFCDFKAPA